jgi:hypothetical protein
MVLTYLEFHAIGSLPMLLEICWQIGLRPPVPRLLFFMN